MHKASTVGWRISVLEEALEKHNMDLNEALNEYSEMKNPDAEAICDLSMYNYEEGKKYLLINSIKKIC